MQKSIELPGITHTVSHAKYYQQGPSFADTSLRELAHIQALLDLASPATSWPGAQPCPTQQALLRRIGTLLHEVVIAHDDAVLLELCSHEPTTSSLIGVLQATEGNAALWCLAAAAGLVCPQDSFKRFLGQALNVDLSETHAWIAERNLARERFLTSKFIASVIEHPAGHDLELFRLLKHFEMNSIAASGISPGLMSSRAFLKNPSSQEVWKNADCKTNDPCFPLIHPWQRILQSLAFHSPEFCRALLLECTPQQFQDNFSALGNLVPVYMVITRIGYPMGGGESFMHGTCRILSEIGYRCIWISFGTKDQEHLKDGVAFTPYYEDVRIAGGTSADKLDALIGHYRPDLIHSQGEINSLVQSLAARHRIPALVGYHFWQGLVRLARGNRNIRKNIAQHQPVESVLKQKPAFIQEYVASEFMLDIYNECGGRRPLAVYHPVSDPAHYLLDLPPERTKVVQINIASGKGGETFLSCVRALGADIPFLGVRTEPNSTKLDEKIRAALNLYPNCEYREYGSITTHLAHARLVLVPTLVDETFCRVALEAAANGIPVLSTRNGFLPQLLGDTGLFLPDDQPNEWIEKIKELSANPRELQELGNKQRERVLSQFGMYPRGLLAAALRLTALSPVRNLGFFAPWSEQGLGEQTRNYAALFHSMGLKTHVFSYQAYSARDSALATQAHPQDWLPGITADTVHYSLNDRERVTLHELQQFAMIRNLGTFVYPEVCFSQNWWKITNLKVPGLRIATVPNIETVRGSEVPNHNRLHSTWFNTKQAMEVLGSRGVTNGRFIGHGAGSKLSDDAIRAKMSRTLSRGHIVFCHFGGHNPVSRKQTGTVVSAFTKATCYRCDILLKIFIMDRAASQLPFEKHDQIEYHLGSLRHSDVLRVYDDADVSVQISSHEGLGLGFYELVSRATPVISIDIPPHNEVVQHGKSGWLLDPVSMALTDNSEALVTGALINEENLVALLVNLDAKGVAQMQQTTAVLFNERFTGTHLSLRLAGALHR